MNRSSPSRSPRQRRVAILLSVLTIGAFAQSPSGGVLVQPGTISFSCPSQAPTWQFCVSTDPDPTASQFWVYTLSQPTSSPVVDVPGVFTTPNVTYYWGYRISYNSWDVYQGSYAFTTSTTALLVPTQAQPAHNAGNNAPAGTLLTWNTVSGATGYDIEVSENSYFNLALQSYSVTSGATIQYSYVGTTCKEYWWRVRAKNASLTSAWSPGRRFYTQTAATTLSIKMALQGPLNTTTMIMNENPAGVPLTQPYTGLGVTDITNSSFSVTVPYLSSLQGNDKVVDWIYVELRNGITNAPLSKYALLLQRDGDVVGLANAAPSLVFPMKECKVSVRHKNHLGAMYSASVFPCDGPVTIDFTQTSTSIYGTAPTATVNTTRRALWMGDTNRDGAVKYTGAGNDRDPILLRVGSTTPNSVVSGIYSEDVNLDGVTKYTGANNDRDPVLLVIGSTTPNTVRVQQLP